MEGSTKGSSCLHDSTPKEIFNLQSRGSGEDAKTASTLNRDERSGESVCPMMLSTSTNHRSSMGFKRLLESPVFGQKPLFRDPSCTLNHSNFNSANMMPELSNTVTSVAHKSLSTKRQNSSIPKIGGAKTWEYPSSLQFFKAMELRNKCPESESIDDVVYTHNWVNEESWKEVLQWEQMHQKKCKTPSLARFVGRYDDLTLKGRWNSYFTHLGRPFDRHDWIVDRCGKSVRYIIDYYDDNTKKDDIQVTIDVRPAPDSFLNVLDRIRRPLWNLIHRQNQKKR